MAKDRNFFWLSGDRYLCLCRKNRIVEDFKKKGGWVLIETSDLDVDEVSAKLRSRDVFGEGKTVYFHDGKLPSSKKLQKTIEGLKQNKALILIEGDLENLAKGSKVDERTSLYKRFSDCVEHFNPVIQKNGYPDRNIVRKSLPILKKISSWNGSEETLKNIFKSCNYDFGKAICEIEKERILLVCNGNSQDSEIKVKGREKSNDFDNCIDMLFSGQIQPPLSILNDRAEKENNETLLMMFFGKMIETFTFIMFCRMAKDSGEDSPGKIASFVSERWQKEEDPIPPEKIRKRLYFFEEKIGKTPIETSLRIISKAEKSINDFIMKRGSERFLINRFIYDAYHLLKQK